MFSGKSEELIRRVRRAVSPRRAVQVFKPAIDIPFNNELVSSHDTVPTLLALAQKVDKLEAVPAFYCGQARSALAKQPAKARAEPYDEPIIVIGAREAYEARCRGCHEVPRRAAAAPARTSSG